MAIVEDLLRLVDGAVNSYGFGSTWNVRFLLVLFGLIGTAGKLFGRSVVRRRADGRGGIRRSWYKSPRGG